MNQKDLIKKLNDAASIIHNANLRGGSNYMIVSPQVADAMEEALNPEEYKRKMREKKLKRILNDNN